MNQTKPAHQKSLQYIGPETPPDEALHSFLNLREEAPLSTFLVVPTSRLARSLRNQLLRQGLAIPEPCITTLPELAEFLIHQYDSNIRILRKQETALLIRKILQEQKDKTLLFQSKSAWGRQSTELQKLFSIFSYRQVQFPEGLGNNRSEKAEDLGLIWKRYSQVLSELGCFDRAGMLLQAASILQKKSDLLKGVVIYGLFEPSSAEQDFIQAIVTQSSHCIVYHPFIQKNSGNGDDGTWLNLPPEPVLEKIKNSQIRENHITVIQHSDTTTEMQAIATACKNLIKSGTNPEQIAVSFPDLSAGMPLLEEVFQDIGVLYSSSTGRPATSSPVVVATLQICSLVSGSYTPEDVHAVLTSPYLNNSFRIGQIDAGTVDRLAHEAGVIQGGNQWKKGLNHFIESQEKQNAPSAAIRRIEQTLSYFEHLHEITRPLETKTPPAEYVRKFREVLEKLGFFDLPPAPDTSIAEQEQEGLDTLLLVLADLARPAPFGDKYTVGPSDFKSLLLQSLAGRKLPVGKHSHGVEILGIRELQGLSFEHLFLGRITEDLIPKRSSPLPWLNDRETAELGTLQKSDLVREERFYFQRACHSAKNITLSYANSDGKGTLIPSVLIAEALSCGASETEPPEIIDSKKEESMAAGRALAAGEIPTGLYNPHSVARRIFIEAEARTGPCTSVFDGTISEESETLPDLKERTGYNHVYSPTALEIYAVCPLRYFFRYLLRLKQPETEDPLGSPARRGEQIHEILFRYLSDIRQNGMVIKKENHMDNLTGLIATAHACAEDVIIDDPVVNVWFEHFTTGKNGTPGILEQFLFSEEEREDDSFIPTLFEYSFGHTQRSGRCDPRSDENPLSLQSPEGHTILLSGSIDRVDCTPEGKAVVLDYKTGSFAKLSDIKKGTALQLPLYMAALRERTGLLPICGAYYAISEKECGPKAVLFAPEEHDSIRGYHPSGKIEPGEFEILITSALKHADEMIGKAQEGLFPLSSDLSHCPSYCEFSTICRKDPLRLLESERSNRIPKAEEEK